MAGPSESAGASASAPTGAGSSASKKSGKKKGGEGGATSAPAKHPNQYTYRNKERPGAAGAAASGSASAAGASVQPSGGESPSPSPSKPRQPEGAAARRGAASLRVEASASRNSTPTPHTESSGRANNPGSAYGLPDHLAHLFPLLADASLEPLELHPPAASKVPLRPVRNGGDGDDEAPLVEAVPYTTTTVSEARTKIRFPAKRMTLGEMRKRVRHIGEYVARAQLEAVERARRMRLLGIDMTPTAPDEEMRDAAAPDGANGAAGEDKAEGDGDGDKTAAVAATPAADTSLDAAPARRGSATPQSMRLAEELSRELASFTQRFGAAPGVAA